VSPRPPFDPARARGAAAAPTPAASASASTSADGADRPWTVSETAERIGRVLLDHLPGRIRVTGEVSNLSDRNHWFFSLKDDDAVLRCVAWASRARRFGFVPDRGDQVVATGTIQFYGPQGQCQLYVEQLEPAGAGPLEARFRALCAELRELGWFDPERKRPLPVFPRRIAVVTSTGGAAVQDVLDTMRRRCPAVEILLVNVRVQGANAAPEIVAALGTLARRHRELGLDAVLLTRGGGSLEDLWAFNERAVAEAVRDFPLPVVAAIGHETDVTVAELVADLRAATPTQAAVALGPDRRELLQQIEQTWRRLDQQIRVTLRGQGQSLDTFTARLGTPESRLAAAAARLASTRRALYGAHAQALHHHRHRWHEASARLERVRPVRQLLERERDVALLADRLARAATTRRLEARRRLSDLEADLGAVTNDAIDRRRERTTTLADRLRGLDPRLVLRRGYSITRTEGGRVLRDATAVAPGDRLVTRLASGEIASRAEPGRGDESPPPAAPSEPPPPENRPPSRPRPRRRRRRGGSDPGQMDLFRSSS